MRFCRYCGAQVSDDVEQCPQCSKYIGEKSPTPDNQSPENPPISKQRVVILKDKDVMALAAAAIILLIVIFLLSLGKCVVSGCNNKAVSGMRYCYNHKCAITSCDREQHSDSNYCYPHYMLYDDDAESSYSPVYSDELTISNVELSSNSTYTIAEGTITNTSDQTVSYVEIKGAFKDSSGTVLDTDWTYAVVSEGLAPGESCTWRMSVKKNWSVRECSVSILDFDY